MSRTAAGALLTAKHRQEQGVIAAGVTRSMLKATGIWTGDAASFAAMVDTAVPLVKYHRAASSSLAGEYFTAFRSTERVGGSAAARLVTKIPDKPIVRSLYVTGLNTLKRGIQSGFTPTVARQNAVARMSGAMIRHALNGSRETLIESVAGDRAARGWYREASGTACAFCAMAAANGAVYATAESAGGEGNQWHDFCQCSVEPMYNGSELPVSSQKYKRLWNDSTLSSENAAEARAAFRQAVERT